MGHAEVDRAGADGTGDGGAGGSGGSGGVETAAGPIADRLDLGVVGYGRVGAAFAAALERAGHRIVAVHARSAASRARARERFSHSLLVTPGDVARAAGVVLVTVPDYAIGPVVDGMYRAGALRAGQVVAHASGRPGLGPLDPAAVAGAARAAIHPVMTLPGGPDDAGLLAGAAFGVTADPAAADVVAGLVADMGGRLVQVPEENRVLYHAALVFGANFLATLANAAVATLRTAGVVDPDPAAVLAPLLRASLDNALALGEEAMTGPVRRGDAETLRAHAAELRRAAPELLDAYLALSALTAERLERAGSITSALAEDVRSVLAAQALEAAQ